MRIIGIFLCLFLPLASFAGAIKFNPSGKRLEGIPVASSAVQAVDKSIPVALLGTAVREREHRGKKVTVFVGQLFGSEPKSFVRTADGALSSLAKMHSVVLHMTCLKTGTKGISYSVYTQLMKRIGIRNTPEIQKFLNAVVDGGDVVAGESFDVISIHSGKMEEIVYQDQHGKLTRIQGYPGFISDFFSFWFKPVDKFGEAFRDSLIKSP